jgi:AcrR family transcriptional regulator
MDSAKPAHAYSSAQHHRRRLLDGLAVSVARRGYSDTTIADIAAAARVSKRTFYEHFGSKQQCMIALYESASELSRRQMEVAIDESLDWSEQVKAAVHRYFNHLSMHPVLMRALFMEILSLGPDGLKARRDNLNALAGTIARSAASQGVTLSLPQAASLAGMLSEWVLLAIEEDRVAALTDDAPVVAAMLRAAIIGHKLIEPQPACSPTSTSSQSQAA